MNAIARRLGATEGQVWSVAIGLVLATVLAVVGIPPVVHHGDAAVRRAPSFAAPPASVSAVSQQSPTLAGELAAAPVLTGSAVPVGSSYAGGVPPLSPVAGSTITALAVPAPFGTVTAIASEKNPLAGVAEAGGTLLAATDAVPSHVYWYDRTGRKTGDVTITGQPAHASNGITGLVVGSDGALYATDAASARVLRLDTRRGAQTTVATIPDVPLCLLAPGATMCKQGVDDNPPLLRSIIATADNTLFVADSAQGIIWRIGHDREPEIWSESLDAATGDGQTALALGPDHSIVYTVGNDLNLFNPAAASVYRVPIRGDGSAGSPVLLTKLSRGDQPTGIAVSKDGRMFVALHAAGAIVVLREDGSEVIRIRAPVIEGAVGLATTSAGDLIATTHPKQGPSALLRVSIA